MVAGRDDADQVTRVIGGYGELSVHLAVRAAPSLDAGAPEEFAITLFVSPPGGPTVDIARIDTSHDGAHFDRFYLPEDDPRSRDYGVEIVDYRDAVRILLAQWREHVEAYARNHRLPGGATRD